MLIIVIFNDSNKNRQCNLYYNYEALYEDTFSPEVEILSVLELGSIKGKTYQDRKNSLENKAIEYSLLMPEIHPISYGEIYEIENYFYHYGKQLGLLKEFRENCIC